MSDMRSIRTDLMLAALNATAPAVAAELTGMASLSGTCERIATSDKDMSADCDGRILQTTHYLGKDRIHIVRQAGSCGDSARQCAITRSC
jgi:hypothetical protein